VSGEQVDLVDRPITPGGDGLGVMGERPPEVGDEPVGVVDRFGTPAALVQVVRPRE
jgi:hypothetical protein